MANQPLAGFVGILHTIMSYNSVLLRDCFFSRNAIPSNQLKSDIVERIELLKERPISKPS